MSPARPGRRQGGRWASMRVALAAALAASLCFALSANSRAASAGSSRPALSVTVDPSPVGRALPAGFVGISLEYNTVPRYAGGGSRSVNPVLMALIRNLASQRRPVLRIGGDTTDWSWWPVPGMRRPRGIKYDLTPAWIASAQALAQDTRARLILGINLEAGKRKLTVTEARALLGGLGRHFIDAFEVGNEPDLYARRGSRRSKDLLGRPPTWSFPNYVKEFSRVAPLLPAIPLAGPATGQGWLRHYAQFVAAEPSVGVVTVHAYQLGCHEDPSSSAYATIPRLLAPAVWRKHMRSLARSAAYAHRYGAAFRIGEMNAVSCGGQPGVSDTFASALWAVEALFEAASAGVDGVNVHTHNGSAGRVFTFRQSKGEWLGTVSPIYYGMLMFAQAAPPGARLLSLSAPRSGQMQCWATLAADGTMRVELINDSLRHGRSVVVRPARARGSASLERLQAPSAHSATGVTLGGQSFGTETSTGTLSGPRQTTLVRPRAGDYTVSMPAASAALLTISPNPAHSSPPSRASHASTAG